MKLTPETAHPARLKNAASKEKVPVYWLKQKIDEQRRREITNGRDEVSHDGPAKQGLVCQNVVRGGCGVA